MPLLRLNDCISCQHEIESMMILSAWRGHQHTDSATSTTASTSVQGELLISTEAWRHRDVVLLGVMLSIDTSSVATHRCQFVMDDVDLEVRHLVHHGINTHTPYLAHHYRRNLVSSLPRGIPTVVDESVKVCVIRTIR